MIIKILGQAYVFVSGPGGYAIWIEGGLLDPDAHFLVY